MPLSLLAVHCQMPGRPAGLASPQRGVTSPQGSQAASGHQYTCECRWRTREPPCQRALAELTQYWSPVCKRFAQHGDQPLMVVVTKRLSWHPVQQVQCMCRGTLHCPVFRPPATRAAAHT